MNKKYTLKLLTIVFLFSGLLSSLYALYTFRIWKSRANNTSKDEFNIKKVDFVENEILIKVKKGVKEKIKTEDVGNVGVASLNKLFNENKVKKIEKIFKNTDTKIRDSEIDQWYKITLEDLESFGYKSGQSEVVSLVAKENMEEILETKPAKTKINALIFELENDPNIEIAEPNYIAEILQTPILCSGVCRESCLSGYVETPSDDCAAGQVCCVLEPTSTPIPTPTFAPTLTPIPTSIPLPTAIPTPTDIPTPTVPQYHPNDPFFSSSGSWGQPYDDLWGLKNISMSYAWPISQGDGVVVAVIDTGLDYNHEDIQENVWINEDEIPNNAIDDDSNGYVDDYRGWDFVTYDGTPEDNDPMDGHGHGTHVSGTVAAVGNNGIGVIGVAPKAKIMAIKGLDNGGSGTFDDLSRAIIYTANNGADVINASWGGQFTNPDGYPQVLKDAIDYVHDVKGVTFVAASGNSNSDMSAFFPAAFRDVISVASSDHLDQKSDFSNYGVMIDVSAPGGDSYGGLDGYYQNILSLRSGGTDMYGDGLKIVAEDYYRARGTSMASPHVAGVAALVKSVHSDWEPEKIRQVLRKGSDDIMSPDFGIYDGYGRINAHKSVNEGEPLIVRLTLPFGETTDLDYADIAGYVYGSNFKEWKLEYGKGELPTVWNLIASSNLPVLDENILARLDAGNVADGFYSIRLTAQTTSGTFYEDRTLIIFDRFFISEPASFYTSMMSANGNLYRGGETINITGTVTDPAMTNYTIKIYHVDTANQPIAEVVSANITLANDGFLKVKDGLLGFWDTTGISSDWYMISLLENYDESNQTYLNREDVVVVIDTTLHSDWPKKSFFSNTWYASTTYDINNDGKAEVVYDDGSYIHMYEIDGSELPGWPQRHISSYDSHNPSIADIDDDGNGEIIYIADYGYLSIWESNGDLWSGYPKSVPGNCHRCKNHAIDDMNNDGIQDIVYVSMGDDDGNPVSTVNVIDVNANSLLGWPASLPQDLSIYPTPWGWRPDTIAIGDLDNDGEKEVVVWHGPSPISSVSGIFIAKAGGEVMSGWPKYADAQTGSFVSMTTIADLDYDQDLEIIIGTSLGKVYAYHHDGTIVSGWPVVRLMVYESDYNHPHWPSGAFEDVTVGDVNGDMLPEIVAQDNTYRIYVWDKNAQLLSGWPRYPVGLDFPLFMYGGRQQGGGKRISLKDVDNDAKADIVAGSVSDYYWDQSPTMIAYKFDGSILQGFPKYMSIFSSADTPAIDDIDGDGLLELVTVGMYSNITYLLIFNLDGAVNNTPLTWPMWAHDAQHSSNLNHIPFVLPTPTLLPTPTPIPSCVCKGKRVTANYCGVSLKATCTSSNICTCK